MTRQPSKQRTNQRRASLHEKQKQVRATLSDDLREEYGQRNVRVNTGDTVEVMRGDYAGDEGEVTAVHLDDATIHVESVTVDAADGEEVPRPVDASTLRVIDLTLDDDRRQARLESEEDSA